VRIPAGPGGFAVGEGAVWAVSDVVPTLTRIDPDRNAVAATTKIKLTYACAAEPPGCGEAAAGDGAVWLTHTTGEDDERATARARLPKRRFELCYLAAPAHERMRSRTVACVDLDGVWRCICLRVHGPASFLSVHGTCPGASFRARPSRLS
jgi:hypothetical protein